MFSISRLLPAAAILLASAAVASPPVPGVSQSFKIDLDPEILAAEGQPLLIDRAEVSQVARQGRHVFADFPLSLWERVDLDVERIDSPGRHARNVIVEAGGEVEVPTPELDLFRGRVVGDPDSRVFLALGDCGVNGWIVKGDRRFVISSGSPKDPHAPAIFDTDTVSFREIPWKAFACSTRVVPGRATRPHADQPPAMMQGGGACRTLEIALDTDNEFRGRFDSTFEALSYLHTLLAAVDEVYRDELQLQFDVVYARIWNVPDPWVGMNGEDGLDEFESHWDSLMDHVHRDLAHMVASRNIGGGRAYLDALCDYDDVTWTISYGISGNIFGSFPTPLVRNDDQNWDPIVVSHEIGHNCGATHTHDLSPPYDQCVDSDGEQLDCSQASSIGTIMSYCHLCPGGNSNVSLEFAPPSKIQIWDYVDGMDCLPYEFCESEPGCVLSVDPVERSFEKQGGTGTLVIEGLANGCSWTVTDRSSWITVTDPGPGGTSGSMQYSVAPNPSTSDRTGWITVGNRTHVVRQCGSPCTFTVSPSSGVIDISGVDSLVIDVSLPCDACAWTPVLSEDWMFVLYSGPRAGSDELHVEFVPNDSGAARMGTVTIADRTVVVYQRGPDWSPQSIPSLQAWFDASRPSDLSLAGLSVNSWRTRSEPHYVPTATSTARPQLILDAIAGRSVIRFDGVNDGLSLGVNPLLKAVNGASIFAMRRFASVPTASRNVAFVATGTDVRNPRLALRGSSTGKPEGLARRVDANATTVATAATAVPPLSVYQVHGAVADYATGRLTQFVNGRTDGSATMTTGLTSATDSKGLGIGRAGNAAGYFAGDVGELLIVGSALGTQDRQRLEGYLAHRWGLAASLPADHPYKAGPAGQVLECVCGGSLVEGERVVRSALTTVAGPPVGSVGTVIGGNATSFVEPKVLVAWDGYAGTDGGTSVQCPMLATASGNNGFWVGCDEIAPLAGPACAYSLGTPSPYVSAAGGTLSLSLVTAEPGCPWTAGSNAAWLVPSLGSTSGVGSDTLTFTFSSNPFANQRTATITVAGQTFIVIQLGSSSQVWTPADLPGLEAWYLADSIPSADRPFNAVSRWVDVEGDFDVTATGTQRPSFIANGFAGRPVVRFDGVEDGLSRGASTLMRNANGGAIFAVRRHSAVPTATRTVAFLASGTSLANARFQLRGASTGKPDAGARRLDSNFLVTATGTTAIPTSMQVQGGTVDYVTGQLSHWVNGTAAGSAATTVGLTSDTNALGFAIGRSTSGQQFFQGDVGEVVMVRGALAASDRQKLEGYLAHRWGLQASLPASHPYREAPPQDAPTCTYVLSSATASVGAAAGSGSVTLTASAASCGWSATSDAAWLVPGVASGTGSATLSYSFTANAGTGPRTGTITVGGQTHAVTQAGTPATAWTPAEMPGLEAWFKADAIDAADRVDGLVSRWGDSASAFHVTATATKRPQWIANAQAGKAVVRFDGVDDGLAIGSSTLLRDAEASVIFVVRRYATVPTVARTAVYVASGGATNAARIVLRTTSTGLPEIGARRLDSDATVILSSTPAVTTGYQIHGAIGDFTGGKLGQWIDGAAAGSSPVTTGRTSATNSLGFSLGRTVSSTAFLSGDLAEVVVARSMPTTCERQKLEGYLAHRWGIASSLPVGHPFRNAPPSVSDTCGSALVGGPDPEGPAIRVPGDVPSLQAAIDAASDGATILLAPGVHAGGVTVSGISLSIESEAGPEWTVLDGGGEAGSVIRVVDGAVVRIEGLTIRGGSGGTPVDLGDGVVRPAGGGVFVRDASVDLVGCIVTGNRAGFGAGVAAVNASIAIAASEIRGNRAAQEGGGVWLSASESTVAATIICDNEPDEVAGDLGGKPIPCGPCAADLDGDGVIGAGDLVRLMSAWGEADADLDGDGETGGEDLAILLEAWGTGCGS